jgi:hypothetical protein
MLASRSSRTNTPTLMPFGQLCVKSFDAYHPYALMSVLIFPYLLHIKVAQEGRHEFVNAKQSNVFADTRPRSTAKLEHCCFHVSELLCRGLKPAF